MNNEPKMNQRSEDKYDFQVKIIGVCVAVIAVCFVGAIVLHLMFPVAV